jgi:antitoxin component HigA of HigAB toxin-antitoxin module
MKITNELEYEMALEDLKKLMDAKPGTKEARRLVALADAIEAYEDIHYPIDEEGVEEYAQ